MKILKKMQMAVVAIALVGTMAFETKAQDRGLDAMLVGAGSGALVGQVIGRDAKATLIGTAVGGALGLMVGNEMERGYDGGYRTTQAAVFFPPPPPILPFVYSPNHRDHRDGYRPHHRPPRGCWEEVVTVERHHGRYRDVVRTVCRDDRDRGWGRDHHRGYWRGDRYDRRSW
jgi:hypothetical protein